MATQRVTRNSQQQNRISQGSNSRQTSLLDWMVKDKSGNFKSVLKESSSVEDSTRTDDRTEGALQVAVGYFQKGKGRLLSLCRGLVLYCFYLLF
jgi:centromere protein I